MLRRIATSLCALSLSVAACSGSPSATTTSRVPPPTTTTTSTSTGTTPPSTSTTLRPGIFRPGEPGIGDPYFEQLGNGGYDVEHYTLDLSVDPVANRIEGTAIVEAVATANLSSFNLDLIGLEVIGVAVDDQPTLFTRDGIELVVEPAAGLAAGETFVAAITYRGTPEPQALAGFGLRIGWLHDADTTYVISEPSGAQTWFPVNDHPLDKATYTFRITVPEGTTAAANGVLVEETTTAAGTTFVWEMRQPMASYLATVVTGDLTRIETAGPDGLVIRNYFPPDLAETAAVLFARTGEMIELIESIAGPYPFDEYGVVVAGEFGAALETQSLSVFGRPVMGIPAEMVERVALHELAHQWFGNSVSPRSWRDVWLNEGFATFFELLWLEHTGGAELYDAEVRELHLIAEGFGPPGDPGVEGLFGGGVYVRGGLTLHALRAEVGDDALFAILRAYYERFAYGNAATADFIAVAEEISGRDLGALFAAWLDEPDLPPLP